MDYRLPLFVIIPLGAAFLIPLLAKLFKRAGEWMAVLSLLALSGLAVYFVFLEKGARVYEVGGWRPLDGIPIGIYMVLDGLSIYLLLVINLIGFLSAFYSLSYMKKFTAESLYYTLFMLMIAGMNGLVLSGDIFNLFVFMEIAAIASYALVAFGIEKEELEASFKYQVLGGISSLLILLAIGLLYWQSGTLNLADLADVLRTNSNPVFSLFIQTLLIAGFGLKTAMFPFHAWLPDAHSSAPSPISSMLSGVLIKAIGAYVLMRLFFNIFALSYDIALVLAIIGTLSMVIGVLLAVGQWDFKRLLAYHSISQMGYVVVGVAMGMMILARNGDLQVASLAIAGGLFHLMNHAVFKSLLFLNAGAVEYAVGTRNMKDMGGLADKMPVTAATSLSASMAISGIPPFNGFFSKLIIIIAAVQAGYYVLAFLAVFTSIITLASFLKMQRFTFYNKIKSSWNGTTEVREAPFSMLFSMVVLAVLCLALSLLAIPSVRDAVLTPAVNDLLLAGGYGTVILGK